MGPPGLIRTDGPGRKLVRGGKMQTRCEDSAPVLPWLLESCPLARTPLALLLCGDLAPLT